VAHSSGSLDAGPFQPSPSSGPCPTLWGSKDSDKNSMPRSGMPFAVHFPRVFEFLYLVEHAPFPRHSRAPRTFECPAAKSMCAAFSKQKTSARAPQKPVTNLSVAIGTGFPRFRTASTGSAPFLSRRPAVFPAPSRCPRTETKI
jgi:hypothetical protein